MKNILLFGAGKSASVLIDYLITNAAENNWHVTIVDADKKLIEQKTKNHLSTTAIEANITNDILRIELIKNSDLIISMMPPFLHIHIAKDCATYAKHLLTASYADEQIKALSNEVKNKGIIFLCEMGLDPGLDHMSAMQIIDTIKNNGGKITSFVSHCGGLVAPQSDDNPWHYKISWNPRNVVLAGKAGAEYVQDSNQIVEKYETLFNANRTINTADENIGELSYYPNRNSLPYIDLYNLHDAKTFIRTTLRHKDFMLGWKTIIDLKLTDEDIIYQSDDMSLANFYATHFTQNEITLKLSDKDKIRLQFLGLNDNDTIINKGKISAADGLQFALEKKLVLSPTDKDMIVMQHEIEYELASQKQKTISSLVVYGKDSIHTAMAKTVGLPLGIAAKLILNGSINLSGIHLPIIKEIYEPVLKELEPNGVVFKEVNSIV
ncbi:MAG: saccharopine dehydrogenase C-terminal domain-containing protein [Ferruginibacter sp.]|nr:saccharopine dehydrogenase [Ferruginibacter sp.]